MITAFVHVNKLLQPSFDEAIALGYKVCWAPLDTRCVRLYWKALAYFRCCVTPQKVGGFETFQCHNNLHRRLDRSIDDDDDNDYYWLLIVLMMATIFKIQFQKRNKQPFPVPNASQSIAALHCTPASSHTAASLCISVVGSGVQHGNAITFRSAPLFYWRPTLTLKKLQPESMLTHANHSNKRISLTVLFVDFYFILIFRKHSTRSWSDTQQKAQGNCMLSRTKASYSLHVSAYHVTIHCPFVWLLQMFKQNPAQIIQLHQLTISGTGVSFKGNMFIRIVYKPIQQKKAAGILTHFCIQVA